MQVQWVNREVQKLAAGGAGEDSYFGKSLRPKYEERHAIVWLTLTIQKNKKKEQNIIHVSFS
jgi:hypothetical protein